MLEVSQALVGDWRRALDFMNLCIDAMIHVSVFIRGILGGHCVFHSTASLWAGPAFAAEPLQAWHRSVADVCGHGPSITRRFEHSCYVQAMDTNRHQQPEMLGAEGRLCWAWPIHVHLVQLLPEIFVSSRNILT